MPQSGRRSLQILAMLMQARSQYHQINVCHYLLMLQRRWRLQEKSRAWCSFRVWFVKIPLFVQKKYPQRIHASWLREAANHLRVSREGAMRAAEIIRLGIE